MVLTFLTHTQAAVAEELLHQEVTAGQAQAVQAVQVHQIQFQVHQLLMEVAAEVLLIQVQEEQEVQVAVLLEQVELVQEVMQQETKAVEAVERVHQALEMQEQVAEE
jgi:hypothetical protein